MERPLVPQGFGGNDNGINTAAILMSQCTTCKNVRVDPLGYLRDLLELISTHPSSLISPHLTPRGLHLIMCIFAVALKTSASHRQRPAAWKSSLDWPCKESFTAGSCPW